MSGSRRWFRFLVVLSVTALLAGVAAPAGADHDPDGLITDGEESLADAFARERTLDSSLVALDLAQESDIISDGPFAKVIKNLQLRGRGMRLDPGSTTDVWAHDGFAYTGTFNSPCGGEPGAGVWVWDVHNKNSPSFVTLIPSPTGSRSNDVKVAPLNAGTILGHSNEACAGGPGGIELYNVDDPANPVHLSSIRADELNPISDALFGGISDVGVHNLFFFTQGLSDFVAINAESAFDNFRIYDITDPTDPTLVSAWGAEEIFDPGVGDLTDFTAENINRALDAALWLLDGFGFSRNRFLHDMTISADGTMAYLSNWDAGLVLLDISDPADPTLVSVALDPENGSRDEEVNSHAAWPSEDGRIVVETEEDFDSWVTVRPPGNLTFGDEDPDAPLPGVAVATSAGDDFEANQTSNTVTVDADSVEVTAGPLAGNTYPAVELAGDQPKLADVGALSGEAVWIGRACSDDPDNPAVPPGGDPILNADQIDPGDIAVARRGACTFRDKNFTAASLGAAGIVIANNVTTDTPWGGVRIWDYSDPANPVLASIFDTVCSASPEPIPQCNPMGTYSVHNVIVETTGNKVMAYFSWYWDGMLVLEVTDPYHPVEVARYFDNSPAFLATNGGEPHDFWGVYKEPNQPWIYGSDRNGGLYVFKEQGSGSARRRG